MAHPLFSEAPSRDMTAAQERQRELDAQIEAFLAKGGKIEAFDNQARPTESTPWGNFSISPAKRPDNIQAEAKVAKPKPVAAAPEPQPEKVIATVLVPKAQAVDAAKEMRAMRKQMASLKRRLASIDTGARR